MLKNYFKGGMLLLAATSFVAANAEGTWRDVTNMYLKDATYVPGWQGVVNTINSGVAETWNAAFRVYQVIPDLPAGEYTLTVNALYRCGNNDYARVTMPGNADLHVAYAFINDTKTPVEGIFDKEAETYPNNQWEADEAFQAGRYVNTVKANHPGGDLVIGICNPGCYWDEWCAYDNFKLTGPDGDVALVNPNFDEGFDSQRSWNNVNYKNAEKLPDTQKDGATGGTYRKCGGSPYKYGQQVELPAGTYRFGMLTFHRCGSEVSADGSKYYNHKSGVETAPYGKMNRTPYDWFQANDYDEQEAEYSFPYIFMSKNESCPKDLNYEDDFGDLVAGVDVRTRVKDCWELNNGDINAMPHNNPMGPTKDGDPDAYLPYETKNKCNRFQDSGHEREAAAAFVAEPEKYYHYVEFTLTEPTKVWVGMGKNEDTSDGYWQPWADQKLEMLVAGGAEEPNIQGTGTAADPYLIATAADLCEAHNLIPQDVAGDFIYFKQTADIDMKNADYDKWEALNGWGGQYSGKFVYDGYCHVIRNFAPGADRAPVDKVGGYYDGSIFGVLRGTVKNLGVIDADTKSDGGFDGAGIISDYSGQNDVPAEITNVFVTGKVAGNKRIGGMLAHAGAANTLTDVYAVVELTPDGCNAGGIIGNLNTKTMEIDGGYVSAVIKNGNATSGLIAGGAGTLKVDNFVTIGAGVAYPSTVTATIDNVASPKFDSYTSAAANSIMDMEAFNDGKELNGMPTFNWMTDAQISSVDNVVVDSDDEAAPAVYYNLQGVRVENPANGLYIKKQGNKVSKVVIR